MRNHSAFRGVEGAWLHDACSVRGYFAMTLRDLFECMRERASLADVDGIQGRGIPSPLTRARPGRPIISTPQYTRAGLLARLLRKNFCAETSLLGARLLS